MRFCNTKHPISNFVSYQSLSPSFLALFPLSGVSIPKTIQNALSDPGWRQTMELEMAASHENGTWELVPLLSGKCMVGCKWVNTVKFYFDSSIG